MAITHTKVSAKADGGDSSLVLPSDWNAAHTGFVCNSLTNDATANSTTTPVSITNLILATGTGTFAFQYFVRYVSSITSTGVKFSVNHTGTVSTFVYWWRWVDVSATASTAAATQAGVNAAGSVMGAMSARAKTTGGTGTTISTDTTGDMLVIVEGLFICTVDGNLELWHGSETAASTTVKAGTTLILSKGTLV